jgi:hypothetical protein
MGTRLIPLQVEREGIEATLLVQAPGSDLRLEVSVDALDGRRASFLIRLPWAELQTLVAEHLRAERMRALENASEEEILGLEREP